MSIPKQVNNNFYTQGYTKNIEMPASGIPPAFQQENEIQPSEIVEPEIDNGVAAVPDELPQEVQDEINKEAQEPEVEQEEAVEEEPEEVEEEVVTPQQRNFKAIREARDKERRDREKAEYERDILLKQLAHYQAQNKQDVRQPAPEPEIDLNIGDEDLPEGKHVKYLSNELKKVRQEMASYKQQSNQQLVEQQLRAQYGDWDRVINRENLQILEEEHPEISEALRSMKDYGKMGQAAYKYIKNMGIYQDEALMAKKATIVKNSAKPKPSVSINPQKGNSPLAKANEYAQGLTPELQKKLRQEMFDAAKKR